ncbi:MAG TPA: type II secretion system F family protein [Candidatus Paceibacterota bacterium]|nr:type II secretion system F family protein [Candidatus Paceibacterota bacterium]
MVFKYKAITDKGEKKEGTVEAASRDLAISALQRRGLVVVSIKGEEETGLGREIFVRVPQKDIVIISRQISTLFEAQVSALKAFSMLASNAENKILRRRLTQVVDDLQAGMSISEALAKHPEVFTEFYTNMVKAGEESGTLTKTFSYLADYLDRQYELTSKTRNALIYPAFVVVVFIAVMVLMMVMVIPKLSEIILESGQDIPIYTRIIIGISNFFVDYGIFILIALVLMAVYVVILSRRDSGKLYLDRLRLKMPLFGKLYQKLFLSRIADNLDTMISSGIPIVHAIEITGSVVGSQAYSLIMRNTAEAVKGGSALSDALAREPMIPSIMVQMMKTGEETGSLGQILRTMAHFYKREVDDIVDTLVSLIEPVMIVVLGIGVGVLLSSILVPIYNIASSIQ